MSIQERLTEFGSTDSDSDEPTHSRPGDGESRETIIVTRDDGDGGTEAQCPYCHGWYASNGRGGLAIHWSKSSCGWPPITQCKRELLRGLLLGDGWYDVSTTRVSVGVINRTFLQWLDQEFGWLTTGVSMNNTATQSARKARNSLGRDTQPEDTWDPYCVRTRAHPWIVDEFAPWYESGEIEFPDDLTLTPTTLRMWFVSDWGLHWSSRGYDFCYLKCCSRNEADDPSVMLSYLEDVGFSPTFSSKLLRLPADERQEFYDFMGTDPVPGFEYKWAWQDGSHYNRLQRARDIVHRTRTLENEDDT